VSPVSNDGPWTLFITLSCTCSVALHYINYSHWKSDHQSCQNPSRPGSHDIEDPAVVRMVNNHRWVPAGNGTDDWRPRRSPRGVGYKYPRGTTPAEPHPSLPQPHCPEHCYNIMFSSPS
jgi:hypothetical protein